MLNRHTYYRLPVRVRIGGEDSVDNPAFNTLPNIFAELYPLIESSGS